jgi:8-oxo-dGTP diphosphatase
MSPIKVSCGIIIENGKILLAQRSQNNTLPLKWEFPGGKVENGETEIDGLIRELREELGISVITVGKKLKPVCYDYGSLSVLIAPYLIEAYKGSLIIKEHNQIKWVEKDELLKFDLASADIEIAIQLLNL